MSNLEEQLTNPPAVATPDLLRILLRGFYAD
jgi:hypothetical protein